MGEKNAASGRSATRASDLGLTLHKHRAKVKSVPCVCVCFPLRCLLRFFGNSRHCCSAEPTRVPFWQGARVLCWFSFVELEECCARVTLNVFVRYLDLGNANRLDARRLEIVAEGVPLYRHDVGVITS